MRKIILDTDLGTDVDDILALTLLAKSPNIDLLGVSTVYGDTALRSRLTRATLDLLGRTDVPVFTGENIPMSQKDIFWAGHEGTKLPIWDYIFEPKQHNAVDFLLNAAQTYGKTLTIFAIGPFTNIGHALKKDPNFLEKIHELVIMGGAFYSDFPEHNIVSDVISSNMMFKPQHRITAIGLDVTTKVYFTHKEFQQLYTLPNHLGELLKEQITNWLNFLEYQQGRIFNSINPHDPLAAMAILMPELFNFDVGEISVITKAGQNQGHTNFHSNPQRLHHIAQDVDSQRAIKEMMKILTA